MKIRTIGKNQTELRIGDNKILVSYDNPVACYIKGQYFRTSKKWSTTTQKHISLWLDGKYAEEMPQEWFDGLLEKNGSDVK